MNPRVRLRAHILLLPARVYPWALVAGVLFCRMHTIARWKKPVETGGMSVVLGTPAPPALRLGPWWSEVVARWVLELTPRDFGFLRSRWCCGAIVLLWVI